jgi:hypothetical protein
VRVALGRKGHGCLPRRVETWPQAVGGFRGQLPDLNRPGHVARSGMLRGRNGSLAASAAACARRRSRSRRARTLSCSTRVEIVGPS